MSDPTRPGPPEPGRPEPVPWIERQTPRLLLRPIVEEDRAEWVRVHEVSAESFDPWSPLRKRSFEELFEADLTRSRRGRDEGVELRLAGFLDDGRIAGLYNVFHIVRGVFQCGVAGWRVNAEVQRQGLGTEGVLGLLDISFDERGGLGLHRVQANIVPENVASVRLAERVGFRREGLAQRYLKIAGEWRDHLYFAKLAEEHLDSPGHI